MTETSPLDFAAVNGVVLHHRLSHPPDAQAREDAGQRPALVFINSLGTDLRLWNAVHARLAQRWRILAYDKRGHGLSSCPPAPYTMDDHVADAVALVEHLGLDRVVPIGISVGGLIAQGLWAALPDRIAALVLCCTGRRIGTPELWNARIATAQDKGVEPLADAVLERWFPDDWRSANEAALAGWRAMLTRTPGEGYAGTSAAIRDANYTATARSVTVPTLCVAGEHDKATPPELVYELADLVPGAERVEMPGSGHLPPIDNAVRMHEAIAAFLSRAVEG